MPAGEIEVSSLSPAEIAEAIRVLAVPAWVRLDKIAQLYARTCPMEAADLLQTAFLRALTGTRQCPRDVDVIQFLAGAMRSIASDSNKAQRREQETVTKHCDLNGVHAFEDTEDGGGADNPLTRTPATPEEVVRQMEAVTLLRTSILSLFADDIVAQTIIEGDMDDLDAEEIRVLADLSKVAYATKRRFIRRRIAAEFPSGWKS